MGGRGGAIDGGLALGAGLVVGGEVAEEGVAGLQVSAGDDEAQAVAGVEQGGGGAERDQDLDFSLSRSGCRVRKVCSGWWGVLRSGSSSRSARRSRPWATRSRPYP